MDEKKWKCFRCSELLVKKPVVFEYMNRSFSYEVPVCPKCGKVYISEALAEGRMAEVEASLEDK
jgi:NAD-dependent SIR2 family protein deacetylase